MCGIVGVVDFKAGADPVTVRRAADTLQKRGPDDSGVWTEGGTGLGHRRLSVIDISAAGHQPMVSRDERYVIVFNGEIYNFLELRRELDAGAAPWQSQTDTEVILAAYHQWGADCVKRFHGMFAFAIWDRQRKELYAARDRMGVKPLYYHQSAGSIAFASRPRALFVLQPALSRDIDEQALRLYLESGYVPAPHSIHRDVRKLAPAHYLLATAHGVKLERYWDFRAITPETSWAQRAEPDLLDELDGIVTRSVRSRMISDVPLGAFLSGGIDSSLVVALMAKHSTAPVKTFTIGFDEAGYDESPHALAVARHLGTEHYCEQLRVNDLLDLMPVFAAEFDEPFFDSSAFPAMAVSRVARKHVTVSLSGDGGDELFGGYHYYLIAERLSALFGLPDAVRGAAAALAGALPQHRLKLLAGALRQRDPVAAFAFARSIAKDYPQVLAPAVVQRTQSIYDLFAYSAASLAPGLSTGEQAMRLDMLHTLPDDYLQKVDLASMAFSLESRDPLLDQDLVEWAMKLPLAWKMRGSQGKYLLRKLAYRYVPQSILDRPKQGFAVPIDAWLRGPLKSWALERLNDRDLFAGVPLAQDKALALFRLHESGKRNVHPLLWAILMFLDFMAQQRSQAAAHA